MYGFGIGQHDLKLYKKSIESAKGYAGSILHPQGEILVFQTENDAKVARNILEFHHCSIGKEIYKIQIDDVTT